MERTISMGIALIFLAACGGGAKTEEPALSEAPISKTVLLQPSWPEALASSTDRFVLEATLKGSDTQGKTAGAVGPVPASQSGGSYQFVFADLPSDLSPGADLIFDVLWNEAGFSAECRKVAVVTKTANLSEETTTLSVASEEFATAYDCDGDGLENIREYLNGTRVDLADTDGDGTGDAQDVFPFDALEWADADADGIGNNADNCLESANEDQADLDEDGLGDFCDPDRDGDGLSNDAEIAQGLNPNSSDTDTDAVSDSEDNCPLEANPGQENADGDPFGDACDCVPGDGTRYKTAADEPDAGSFDIKNDSNCDGVDGNIANAVFVSPGGDDANSGTFRSPFRTLGRAYQEALSLGRDVYAEAGSYPTEGVPWTSGVRFFGGYITETAEKPFGFRCVYPRDCSARSVLSAKESLTLEGTQGSFLFDGFRIDTPLVLRETASTFRNSRMEEGVLIEDADGVELVNNILRANGGRIAIGVEIIGSSPTLTDNTIDATNRYGAGGSATERTSIALIADNALGLKLTGNLLLTAEAENQYGFYCRGLTPAGAGITGNLFALFELAGGTDAGFPRGVSCLGEFDFLAGDGLDLGAGSAEGNVDYPSEKVLTELIDLGNYTISDTGYENFGAR